MNIIPAVSASEFKDIKNWSDNAAHSIKELKGKVVLLDFWTYTCIFCLRTIPTIKKIKETYTDKGLVVFGIHSAEYEFAKNPANIRKALKEFGLDEDVTGYDINNKTWEVYGNSHWPKHILIDRDGFVRYNIQGMEHLTILKNFDRFARDPILLILSYFRKRRMEKSPELGNDLINENEKEQGNNKEQDDVTKIYGMHFNGMAPEISC